MSTSDVKMKLIRLKILLLRLLPFLLIFTKAMITTGEPVPEPDDDWVWTP